MSKFLFDFVKSLTMREKAYFKHFSSSFKKKGQKNYQRIYDKILSMERYDKDELISHFQGESIGKYYSSEMKYLEDQLMKSLVNFHFNDSPKRKLNILLNYIDILIEKDFRKRALKILLKSKKIAYKLEEFNTILKIIQYEEEILFSEGILGFTENLNQLQQERQKISRQIENIIKLRLMREKLREIQFIDGFVNDSSKYPEFYKDPILEDPNYPLSLTAKDHWFYILESRNYLLRDYKTGLKISSKYLDFMESHSYLFKRGKILSTLSNFLYFNALLAQKDAFNLTLERFEYLRKDSTLDQTYLTFIIYTRSFELFYRSNDQLSTAQLLPEASQFIRDESSKMGATQINYILLLMVRSCMYLGKIDEAIDWLNLWNRMGVLNYTRIHFKLFSIILRIEKNWIDLLATEIKTTKIALRKINQYNNLVKAFILLAQKFQKHPSELRQHLLEIYPKLKSIKSNKEENFPFEYFDFEKWCRLKIDSQ